MEEADKAIQEGDKMMLTGRSSSSSIFSFLSGGMSGPDYHEAADKYSQAANLYKSCGEWAMAGSAFLKAVEAHVKDKSPEEAARKQIAAATCYRKAPGMSAKAIELYEAANVVYIRSGRFAMVGNNEKECADIAEKDLGDKKMAADYYKKAADRFIAENSTASAAGCKTKEAALAAEIKDYARAVKLYEEMGRGDALDSSRRFNVKENFFRAGLVRLAMDDLVGTKKAIEGYLTIDPSFASTREFKLLDALASALEDMDADAFTEAIEEFEKVNRLDDWKVTILYAAKQLIDEEPQLA